MTKTMRQQNNMRRLEVRCLCGNWGRLTWKGQMKENKQLCSFICVCTNPHVDFDDPYRGWD
jgi:hypothetical protein